MALQTHGLVVRNENLKSLYFLLTVYCPPIADEIRPGQFVMLKVSENTFPLLRRPFSVFKNYSASHPERKKRGWLLILYKKIGKGTEKMAELKKGQDVDVVGPLGNGFSLPPLPSSVPIIVIGGGIGVASLYSLAETLRSCRWYVFLGARTKDDLLGDKDFKKLNPLKIFVATEDGSLGYKGTVIDLFLSQKKIFKEAGPPRIYSCGPPGMLKELAKAVRSEGMVCQASLEARMGCGFGACWGCVVKTNDPDVPYQRVCKEGPVFDLGRIVWDEL